MSVAIFLAVIGAALLHATWNTLIKQGWSRTGGMIVIALFEIPIGALMIMSHPLPKMTVWPWIAASVLAHCCYKLFLAHAFNHGDLSRVYPITRGTAPLIVTLFSVFFLAETFSPNEYIGITFLGTGILLMAAGAFHFGEDQKLLPFSLGAALSTAAYTLIDGLGARLHGDALSFVAWVFLISGLLFSLGMISIYGKEVLPKSLKSWSLAGLASAASYSSYAIIVWAMIKAPIALVATLRESSIFFVTLIGWLLFKEKMPPLKALATLLILVGITFTRF
jgi:drug/metabolite transporter (DMT)-like permease